MAETTWSNQGAPLGSSYGPCLKVETQQAPPLHPQQLNTPSISAWAPPSNLPNNTERERERDRPPQRPPQNGRPYPASSYDAPPYAYPPAHPHPSPPPLVPLVHHHQPLVQQYQPQPQFMGHPMGQQQQPCSSFGPVGPSPSPPAVLNPNRRPGDWDCPACFAHNFASRSECFKCKYLKPGGVTRRPGDWWCGKCNGHNYAYRVDCFKCGADKAEGNNEPNNHVDNTSSGRWAGDWDCPNCSAHCFASRMECFKCGEPKPIDLSTDN